MTEALLLREPIVRLAAFLGVLVLMMLWELAAPKRRLDIPRVFRWSNHLALVALDTAILRLSFPILAVGLALMANERGWGLFNLIEARSGWPSWFRWWYST